MMRLLLSCAVAALGFASAPAFGQTLGAFNPAILCENIAGDAMQKIGGCTPGKAMHGKIIEQALEAKGLWQVVRKNKARMYNYHDGDNHMIAAAPMEKDYLDNVTAARLSRAESPIFYKPSTGMFYIVPFGEYPIKKRAEYLKHTSVGFDRNIGLSLMMGYRPIAEAFADFKDHKIAINLAESVAGSLSITGQKPGSIGNMSFTGNFSEPFFAEDKEDGGNWGAGIFWLDAYKATKKINPKLKGQNFFYTKLLSAVGIAADTRSEKLKQIVEAFDVNFKDLGWDRFKQSKRGGADGFGQAYAETMARHHIDQDYFVSPEIPITIPVGYTLNTAEEDGLLQPFSTAFFNLELSGTNVRETEIVVRVCRPQGKKCVPDDKLHLLFEGGIADPRTKKLTIKTQFGPLANVEARNHIRMAMPSRKELKLTGKKLQSLKVAVAYSGLEDTKEYKLIVETIAMEAPCTWDAHVATLNPRWRGNPVDFKSPMTSAPKSQWMLTEKAYRDSIGWDGDAVLETMTGIDAIEDLLEDMPREWLMLADASEKDRAFRALMPSAAKVNLSGGVNDSGSICVAPLAVKKMADFSELDMDDHAGILEAFGLPPELATATNEAEAMRAIMGGKMGIFTDDGEELDDNPVGDIVLKIYSPNVFTQQLGMLPPGAARPLAHSGHGGWRPNAGFNIYVTVPGLTPSKMKPGIYPIKASISMGMENMDLKKPTNPANLLPFYSWGEGSDEEIKFKDYVSPSFTGNLSIKKQVAGAAIASLKLTGLTYLRDSEAKCQKEPRDANGDLIYLPECAGQEILENIGNTSITIDRFLILGLAANQPIPVMDMYGLSSARVPAPKSK